MELIVLKAEPPYDNVWALVRAPLGLYCIMEILKVGAGARGTIPLKPGSIEK